MSDRQIDPAPRLGTGITLGVLLGPVVLYCWLLSPLVGAVATLALLGVAWFLGRRPSERKAGASVLVTAVAVAAVLFVLC